MFTKYSIYVLAVSLIAAKVPPYSQMVPKDFGNV
jgi:hypothetical protein